MTKLISSENVSELTSVEVAQRVIALRAENPDKEVYATDTANGVEIHITTKQVYWYLIEFYTKDGAINFAWVYATTSNRAKDALKAQVSKFDEVIQTTEHMEIVPLAGNFRVNTPDANLFILNAPMGTPTPKL